MAQFVKVLSAQPFVLSIPGTHGGGENQLSIRLER